MAKLQLGIGAKATTLLSRMHPKNLISKAYPNQTKADKAEGLIVVSEGLKLICCEEKVVVVSFIIPQKTNRQRNSNVGRCISSFILKEILPETNKCIQEDKHQPVTYGEFLRLLGLWFLMVTITGPDWTAFWSMGEVDCFVRAPM